MHEGKQYKNNDGDGCEWFHLDLLFYKSSRKLITSSDSLAESGHDDAKNNACDNAQANAKPHLPRC